MIDRLEALRAEADAAIAGAPDEAALRELEVGYLGKKGAITEVLKGMKDVAPADRPRVGQVVNEVRGAVESAIARRRESLEAARIAALCEDPTFDATLPGPVPRVGALHPVTQVTWHVEEVFRAMGFMLLDYPEVETDWYNFQALNIPADHPARDMQDTFWLEGGHLLRTHTSPGQIRSMQSFAPPFRAIFPGRVFRYERIDASHEHTFHQVEGLMIDRDISVANLIHSMKTLLGAIFEREVTVRLRPGYFPFVEPGFELDIQCQVCGGSGCSVCKHSGWVELLPCGLVHPNVLRFGGLDPDEWSGWAFGLGLSRLVMMKYQIEDIRHLAGGDLRFVAQFR
ncbi:MAG: phenylalanine--tRNA ligase subunit alpha [Deltaproteobacteria bacterium]|nr:phenylalanine--tRNA ligase subunit alpha [Deltaproteobacteria bacterium]MCB9787277.1 phenylalanine--tRNA ligase subunit alpha [Deltaproteobacteria bacterium]